MKTVLIVSAAVLVAAAALAVVHYFLRPLPLTGFDRQSVTIEVFNGCGVPRIARAVADELLQRGFDVYEIGNSDSLYDDTIVIDLRDPEGGNAEAVALELAVRRRYRSLPLREQYLPAAAVELDSSRFVDLRIVIGSDHERFFPGVLTLR